MTFFRKVAASAIGDEVRGVDPRSVFGASRLGFGGGARGGGLEF
jgi:hypothetical protein